MRRLELLIPPPFLMLITGLIMWLLAKMTPSLAFSWPHSAVVATLVSVLGLFVSVAGVITFKRTKTTVDPRRPESTTTLVKKGVYRYSRNPMYLGVLLILFGWAIHLSNLLSALCPFLFIAYITRFQIIPEERLLQQKFGEDFLNYKSSVRRWI